MSDAQDARSRLTALPGFDAGRVERALLTQLGGLSNRVFKVELDGEVLCLRVPGDGSDALVDRGVEEANARAAAASGLTPEIVHFATDGTMLTRFVEGMLVTPAHLQGDASALRRVAATLARLHASGAAFAGRFRAFETMEAYAAELEQNGAPLSDGHRRALSQMQRIRTALDARPAPLRPCHCDPTGPNLIDTGARVWLIDWEYSAMNDPLWDLAYFSIESSLDEAADHELLAAYFERAPNAAEAARMMLTKAVCEVLAGLWSLVREAQDNSVPGLLDYAERTLSRASARMASPAFSTALETLRDT